MTQWKDNLVWTTEPLAYNVTKNGIATIPAGTKCLVVEQDQEPNTYKLEVFSGPDKGTIIPLVHASQMKRVHSDNA